MLSSLRGRARWPSRYPVALLCRIAALTFLGGCLPPGQLVAPGQPTLTGIDVEDYIFLHQTRSEPFAYRVQR